MEWGSAQIHVGNHESDRSWWPAPTGSTPRGCVMTGAGPAVWHAGAVINGLHSIVKPAARPYAGLVLADLAENLLIESVPPFRNLRMQKIGARTWIAGATRQPRSLPVCRSRRPRSRSGAEAAAETAELRRQLEQARANLARRPAATSLVLPAQKITVESGIQRAIFA